MKINWVLNQCSSVHANKLISSKTKKFAQKYRNGIMSFWGDREIWITQFYITCNYLLHKNIINQCSFQRETPNKRKAWHTTRLANQFLAKSVIACFVHLIHSAWVQTNSLEGTGQGREDLKQPTCLPLNCVLSAGREWRHLRHITGPLIKTHVKQSDRHGKTVWKKLLGIKYIVTTGFQRFINKLTDHLVSIRSDRSTNPGISALGLVGGGRRWLSMRGDIEGKSPCWFQGGPLLTLFQRGSMCMQTPFTPPVFQ